MQPPSATDPQPSPASGQQAAGGGVYWVLITGWLLLWSGVVPWLAVACGAPGYPSVFHSIAQVQGFLLCFFVVLLWRSVERVGAAPPGRLGVLVCVLCPIGVVLCAAGEEFGWSQSFWFVQAGYLLRFVGRRRQVLRPVMPGVDGVTAGLLLGVLGSVLFGIYGALGPPAFKIHELAKGSLLQGMFLAVLVGVGSYWWPQLLGRSAVRSWPPALVAGWCLAFLGTLGLAVYAEMPRTALVLRALLAAVALGAAGLGGGPGRLPGAWAIWGLAWWIPIGFAVAGIAQDPSQAGVHLVFVLGFAGSALLLAARGMRAVPGGDPLLAAIPVLLGVAATARVLMAWVPESAPVAVGVAAGGVLAASLPCVLVVARRG